MERFVEILSECIKWFLSHLLNFLVGIISICVGYFDQIQGAVNVMIIAIFLDLLLGVWAALYLGEAIQSKKLWRTAYKLFIAVGLVSLIYSVEKEIGVIEGAYKGIALLIIGFEIWSMLESAGKITDHRLFRLLQKYMHDRVKETTGVDISDEKSDPNN